MPIGKGRTPVELGMADGQVLFWDGSQWCRAETSELFWDDVNKRFGIGVADPDAKLEINGYAMLGSDAPKIKVKKLTGTSAAVGASVTIVHGLTKSKIIGAQALVSNNTGNRIPPNFTSVGNHEFDFFIDTDNVHVYCISGNSSNIDNNALTVLITYEE